MEQLGIPGNQAPPWKRNLPSSGVAFVKTFRRHTSAAIMAANHCPAAPATGSATAASMTIVAASRPVFVTIVRRWPAPDGYAQSARGRSSRVRWINGPIPLVLWRLR